MLETFERLSFRFSIIFTFKRNFFLPPLSLSKEELHPEIEMKKVLEHRPTVDCPRKDTLGWWTNV